MKLEIKHLAPYLPYGLYVHSLYYNTTFKVYGLDVESTFPKAVMGEKGNKFDIAKIDCIEPILHPISDLNRCKIAGIHVHNTLHSLFSDTDKWDMRS